MRRRVIFNWLSFLEMWRAYVLSVSFLEILTLYTSGATSVQFHSEFASDYWKIEQLRVRLCLRWGGGAEPKWKQSHVVLRTAGRVTFEPAYDALILHMNHPQTLGCFYTCWCALAPLLYLRHVESSRLFKCCVFRQFLLALACSGSVDYVPCVIGSEISAEAACISNDSVGGGLII